MTFHELLYRVSDQIMFTPVLVILLCAIFLSFKTRFIQVRAIPAMIRLLFKKQHASADENTIHPRRALFTAMSTTIGIGNIVAPIIAIGFGGPGALMGFVLATVFGGAATYVEVIFSLNYRKRYKDGTVAGGPMQYLGPALHPFFATLYGVLGMMLLAAWSGNQSNQLAALLEPWHLSRSIVGPVLALLIIFMLIGGVKRIGNAAEKLVPVMFILYTTAMSWIVFKNIDQLPATLTMVFNSFFSVQAVGGTAVGIGFQRALRWGLARGIEANEAGVGTASIAHAVAETKNPFDQAILALVSVYTNGVLCILSGLVILMTGVWQNPALTFDITMMNHALTLYFPGVGGLILMVSGVLFSLSTIIGNSFYGTQCFLYATHNRYVWGYWLMTGVCIAAGAIMDVKFLWSIIDFFLIPVAIPHSIGIVVLSLKRGDLLRSA